MAAASWLIIPGELNTRVQVNKKFDWLGSILGVGGLLLIFISLTCVYSPRPALFCLTQRTVRALVLAGRSLKHMCYLCAFFSEPFDAAAQYCFRVGFLLMCLFVLVENKIAHPVMPMS
jgi:hypothetical protein